MDIIIRKKEDYVADGLGRITEMRALDVEKASAAGEPEVLYEGFAIIGAQIQGRMMQVPVEFAIPDAKTLDDAVGVFQKYATERFQAMMDEARQQATAEQNRIVTASEIPNLKLVQ